MIDCLIKKETIHLEKLACLAHFDEVSKQQSVVFALIKEYARIEKDNINEVDSPIPLLCESYYMLMRLQEMLSKMIIEFADKARIKITVEDNLVYASYYYSLISCSKQLKYKHNILLVAQKNVM